MKLGRKNLLYSLMLAGIMMLLLIGYFICMLPSLYVDHIMEQNLKSIREQHRSYVENRSYKNVQVRNSTACFSVEIPKLGNRVLIAGKAFSAEVIIRDERVYEILEHCRRDMEMLNSFLGEEEEPEEKGQTMLLEFMKTDLREQMERLAEIFRETIGENTGLPVEIRLLYQEDIEDVYFGESVKTHYYADDVLIMEANISDANNQYTNYIAMEQTEDSIIFSFLPVVTPQMDEIRPVVIQSLPMLGAVVLLMVLLFSRIYSRGIVTPVVELVRHTEEMKAAKDFSVSRLYPAEGLSFGHGEDERDEIRQLADTLDDFYLQIKEGYRKLEEENRHQEIFLRASSHQLKTPIAAALLLVDGMISRVGRYKDTGQYLPRVKEQLLSMRKMVEEILYLNRCTENIQSGRVYPGRLLEEGLGNYRAVLADKKIQVEMQKDDESIVYLDGTVLLQILDNLLSNAVKYTPAGGKISVSVYREGAEGLPEDGGMTAVSGGKAEYTAGIRIENFGVTISEELLPHVFEPFVKGNYDSGNAGIHSHGLGLYIAAYYAGKLGIVLSVRNGDNSVVAELKFHRSLNLSS